MKKVRIRKPLIVTVVVVLILTLILTYGVQILATKQAGMASAQITMSFDGIAQGRDPKGNAVDITQIKDDQILSRTLEIADLKDQYTVAELRERITTTPAVANNALQQLLTVSETTGKTTSISDDYAKPGAYAITVKDMGMVNRTQSKLLVRSLIQAYCENLENAYLQSVSADAGYSLDEIVAMDYPEMLDALKSESDSVVQYAKAFATASPDFTAKDTGLSFVDLSNQAAAIYNTDMSTYSGIVNYYMLTKNSTTRKQYEQRKLERAQLRYEKLNARNLSINDVVYSYDNYTNYIIADNGGTNGLTTVNGSTENEYYGNLLNLLVSSKDDMVASQYTVQKIQENIEKLSETSVSGTEYTQLAQNVESGVKTSYQKLVDIRKVIQNMAQEDYDTNVAAKISVTNMQYQLNHFGSLKSNLLLVIILAAFVWALYVWLRKKGYVAKAKELLPAKSNEPREKKQKKAKKNA